jgi:hypothetical protein
LLNQGKGVEAAADFDRATRDPSVLKGNEPYAFEFSFALAQLDAGRTAEAAKTFKALGAKGNESSYLAGAFAKVGPQFFGAYASYRSAQSAAARQQACNDLSQLQGQIGGSAKDVVSACWEAVAYDHYRAGNAGAAKSALSTAAQSANASQQKRLNNNRAVADGLGKNNLSQLDQMGGDPPESLVNLGIVYDMLNKPREAYDAWVRAKAKGVNTNNLQKWIDAKKRIYGY